MEALGTRIEFYINCRQEVTVIFIVAFIFSCKYNRGQRLFPQLTGQAQLLIPRPTPANAIMLLFFIQENLNVIF